MSPVCHSLHHSLLFPTQAAGLLYLPEILSLVIIEKENVTFQLIFELKLPPRPGHAETPYPPIPTFRELSLRGKSGKAIRISVGIKIVICLTNGLLE